MAVSPLADFNWDDLTGENFVTVLKVLCSALQERYNVGIMDFNGVIDGHPSLNPHPTALKNYFPFGNNDPKWMGDTWPLALVNQDINDLLDGAATKYFDKDQLDAQIGDSAPQTTAQTQLFYLGSVPQDPAYPNRLFELAGYTDYPDIKTGSAAELKKLYDLISSLKWVWRPHFIDWSDFPAGANDTEFVGEFDLNQAGFFVIDPDGADHYGNAGYRDINTDGGGFSLFQTGHANIVAGSGDALHYMSDQDVNTYHLDPYYAYYFRFRTTSNGPIPGQRGYHNFLYAYHRKDIYDWSVARAVIGFTGKPNQFEKYAYLDQGSGSNMQHTGFSHTAETENVLRRATPTLVEIDADNQTVEFDENLNYATIPASMPPENTESVVQTILINQWMIEHWNHADGFKYHTDF